MMGVGHQVFRKGEMSFPLTVKAQVRAYSAGVEESWGGDRSHHIGLDQAELSASFSIASRDVIDEVRTRMARRGYVWDK